MTTFSWTADFGATQNIKPRVRKVQFGDGYSQRQADGINTQPQVWDLQFNMRTDTEAAAIVAFLVARAGVEAFEWTPPGQLSALKFVCEEWNRTLVKHNLNDVSLRFTQVFEA